MTIHLAQLALPAASEPGPALRGIADVDAESSLESVGVDMAESAEQKVVRYGVQDFSEKIYLVALAEPPATGRVSEFGLPLIPSTEPADQCEVLGYAWLGLPRRDNLHLVQFDLIVRSQQRGRGIGTALLGAIEDIARIRNRTTLQGWGEYAPEPESEQLVPRTGVGTIPVNSSVRFALSHGMELMQAECHSVLPLPVPPDRIAELRDVVPDDDYRLVQWEGLTPQEYLKAMAQLRTRMSMDVPIGDLDSEPEVWDEERVRVSEEAETAGVRMFTTVARHDPTGELVGYTVIGVPDAKPAHPYQQDTLVIAAHRGHRLGMRLKLANLEYLQREFTGAEGVHTWNAGENDQMLAINTAIGFEPRTWKAAWEKKL